MAVGIDVGLRARVRLGEGPCWWAPAALPANAFAG